jgi:hypothetical protein
MRSFINLVFALFVLALPALAQTVEPARPTDDKAKLEKEAVAFLRETIVDVNAMRSLENRISFSSEIAGLMWYHDEAEARLMFSAVIRDFRELLARYDEQMNAFPEDPDGEGDRPYSGGLLGADLTERSKVLRKFSAALAVRQQITAAMAEHDPDLAFAFYGDTLAAVANPALKAQIETRSSYFESQLLGEIAEKDPAKAVQYASKLLDKSVSYQHIELLKKIYAKDADRGAEFARTLRDRLGKNKLEMKDFWAANVLMAYAVETLEKPGSGTAKRPLLSRDELRDLAEAFAQGILALDPDGHGEVSQYLDTIGRFAPGRVAQIRTRFNLGSPPPRTPNTFTVTGRPVANVSTSNVAYTNSNTAAPMSNTNSSVEREARREAQLEAEQKLYEDVLGLGSKKLPKEDRDKIVAKARKQLVAAPGRDKKIMGLSMLAAQVAQAGDRELAAEIMKEAASFANPSPKNYQDFLLNWILASGYAKVDSARSFALLDELIGRANETISAFVKVGEFIDVAEEVIQDGEVQVGAFGGSMVRGLTRELGVADDTLKTLAAADFGKLKASTNNFDRPEVRVLAKMLVIRAILGKDDKTKRRGDVLSDDVGEDPGLN